MDEAEVKDVLVRMGITAVDELTDYFMTEAGERGAARTMDFDDFCIMLAPDTAAKSREARGVARRTLSPTRRKFPRSVADRTASQLDYGFLVSDTPPNFHETHMSFASSRTSLPSGGVLLAGDGGVATPRIVVKQLTKAGKPVDDDGDDAERAAGAPAPAQKQIRETFLGRMGLRDNLPLPRSETYRGDADASSLEPSDGDLDSQVSQAPALPKYAASATTFTDWQASGLAPEVQAVDDECYAEVSGLRGLSASLADLSGGLEDLKASMSSFWSEKHAKLDDEEHARSSAALVIQKHYRRHVVARRFRQWVDLEDDEDLTSQLEGVRVAVAQFCLASHVDFGRIEKKLGTIQDNLDGANRDSVDADRLLGWNPDVPLAQLAGSRATACRIREWQSHHRPATREADKDPQGDL